MCGVPICFCMSFAWVPLPAPGGPNSTMRLLPTCALPRRRGSLRRRSVSQARAMLPLPSHAGSVPPPAQPPAAHEPLVAAGEQVGLDLGHGVERDADDDEQRG